MSDMMREEISEQIKKLYELGLMGSREVRTVVEKAVLKVVQETKENSVDVRDIARVAVETAVTALSSVESVTKEYIEAAVNGAVEAISKSTKDAIYEINIEFLKTKYHLEEQQERFSFFLDETLSGVKEASSTFSQEIKTDIEGVVTDTRSKEPELLDLMQETIRHSIKATIDEGIDVEAKVTHLTKEVTENALSTGRLSAESTQEVSEAAISAAINAAYETGKEIDETTRGAIAGIAQGVVNTIEKRRSRHGVHELEVIESAFAKVFSDIVSRFDGPSKEPTVHAPFFHLLQKP